MKRLLLDTNIYGELIFDRDFFKLKSSIEKKDIVHGFKVVRDELRDVPKKVKVEGKNLRVGLLYLYDKIYNDFLIVACACINQIDIVVSEDNKSMLIENARKAYDLVRGG